MPATIIDVAKLSGYSKATVSRAYASPNCVKPETREKIYAAAKALNYAPNAIARAMVTKQTENIAFIIHEKQYPVVLNPFYSPILEAVLQECNRHGYSAFISTDHDVRLPNGELYIKKHMDGVILAGQTDYQSILSFRKHNIPMVLLNNRMELDDLLCVTADNYNGAVQAMEHLYERGHRRIGLLASAFSPEIYNARYNGYVSVLKKYDLPLDMRFVQDTEPTMEAAEQYISSILGMPDRPTAFFCTNDTIAIGAIKAALRAGLRVPQDLAIVGFDDSDNSRIIEPELTTVYINKQQMGHLAAQKLFDMIDGNPIEEYWINTPTRLIIRSST